MAQEASTNDRDGDGIPDGDDACPDQAGPRRDDPATSGCIVRIVVQGLACPTILEPVHFALRSQEIRSDQKAALSHIVLALREHPEIDLEIRGHADDFSSARADRELSERRAAAVKRWLLEQGISTARLTTKALGSSQHIDPKRSNTARARNRRVEFTIVKRTEPQ